MRLFARISSIASTANRCRRAESSSAQTVVRIHLVGVRPRNFFRSRRCLEEGSQTVCRTESIDVRLREHVAQSLGRRSQKPGPIRNHGRVGTGLSDGIECLHEDHVSLPAKHDAFGWLHVVWRDNREGSVMLNGRAVWERQLIQMKRTDSVHKSACHLSDWLVSAVPLTRFCSASSQGAHVSRRSRAVIRFYWEVILV